VGGFRSGWQESSAPTVEGLRKIDLAALERINLVNAATSKQSDQNKLMPRFEMAGILIGERGKLNRTAAKQGARLFRQIAAAQPTGVLHPNIGGYEDDPRGLWEIPEACRYLCRWAQFAGIESTADADRFRIDVNMCGVLAKCGVFEDVDADTVVIGGCEN
jgi:hypothetical protein